VTGVVLDTHALVWLLEAAPALGSTSRAAADAALARGELSVSAMTFFEVAMLQRRGRISLLRPVGAWRRTALSMGVVEIPVAGETTILAVELDDFHADPADRIIVATALAGGSELVTADRRILDWSGALQRRDART
jgi:PIN domain nuclease of toxin-antitoxin system